MKTLSLFALATACCALNCVSATVEVQNVCASNSIVLPGNTTGIAVPAGFVVSKDFPVKISDALSKIKDVGDLSVSINSFSLTDGDFSWVSHVKVDASANGSAPLTLVDQDVVGMVDTISLPMSPEVQAQLIEMLKDGETSMTVSLTTGSGTFPTSDETINGRLCVGASVDIKKSL